MSYKLNPFTGEFDYFEDATNDKLEATRIVYTGFLYGDPIVYGDPGVFYGGSDPILAFRAVASVSSTEVVYADSGSYETSKVLGIALETKNPGEDIRIHLFGKLDDASFNFTLNQPLFLGSTGLLTETAPSAPGIWVQVGYSLGTGSIWVSIDEPIILI